MSINLANNLIFGKSLFTKLYKNLCVDLTDDLVVENSFFARSCRVSNMDLVINLTNSINLKNFIILFTLIDQIYLVRYYY